MPIPHFHVKGLLEATSKPTLACDRQALSRVIMNVAIFRCVRGTCKAKKSRVDTVEQKIVTVAQILSHSFFFLTYCMTFSITLLKLLLLFRKEEVCRVFIESFLSLSASLTALRASTKRFLYVFFFVKFNIVRIFLKKLRFDFSHNLTFVNSFN